MTNSEPDAAAPPEDERLRLWREGRLRAAEAARQDRLAQAEIDREARIAEARDLRAMETQADAAARDDEVRRLIPTPDTMAAARLRLRNLGRARKRWLIAQLLVLVLLPTLLVGWYVAKIATPFYETRAVVVVTRADPDKGGDLGGLLPGLGSGGTLNEAFQAYEFIRSEALMQRLEVEDGIITRFSGPAIDPVRRLRDLPVLGLTRHDLFGNFVDASINIQNGLITLYTRAPGSAQAVDLSNRVIRITADHINILADALYAERVAQAENAVTKARATLRTAQASVTQLQIDSGEIDPRARVQAVFASIERLTLDAQTLRAEIETAEVAGTGDTVQTDRLRERERLLTDRIAAERAVLVSPGDGTTGSLNGLLLAYDLAVLEVSIAETTLTTALQSADAARQEAALGRNIFQVVVPPVPSDQPTRPNPARTVLLAFLLFLGGFSVIKLLLFRP